jgi:predicted ATP-binding protein involved in virulence
MDDKFLKRSLDYRATRDERYKELSRDKLFQVAVKKIQTTMIGALSTLEESFGFLWGFDSNDEKTEDQRKILEIYEDARAKILDRGNTQIRILESEFVNYDIVRKKHFISLPVATNKGEGQDGK